MRLYNFNEVVGNSATVTVIQQSLKNGSFPHISIFSGISGTGKSTCAEICGLFLTCENPSLDEPCCTCPSCTSNIRALQTTGRSMNLIKINSGKLDTKLDVKELIKEIFVLQVSDKNCVYIIEEAHSLKADQQTALLEELDKISDNVYVIFCTTKITSLLNELQNRAIVFNFNRLKRAEMQLVLENLCRRSKASISDQAIKDMLIDHAQGVPRSLVELLEFILSNEFESKTISDFLGIIDDDLFIDMFSSMKSPDMFSFIDMLTTILEKQNLTLVIKQLRDFMIRVVFNLEGGIKDRFSDAQITSITSCFRGTDYLKISSIIASISLSTSDASFKFKMIQVRNIMQSKSLSSIISNAPVDATIQQKRAEQQSLQVEKAMQSSSSNQLKSLDLGFLSKL